MCSIEPPTRRPPGPRNERSVAETIPNVVRSPRPLGSARANTAAPSESSPTAAGSHVTVRRVAGLDVDHGEVQVGVGAGDAAVLGAPVAERDGDLLAAQDVRAREHPAGGEDDAGAPAPPAPEPDHRGPDAFGRVRHRLLERLEHLHRIRTSESDLQLASHYTSLHFGVRPLSSCAAPRGQTPTLCGVARRAPSSPLADALARVGDRWTLLVVAALLEGPKRFNELQEELDGIAPNVLSARLKALAEEALVVAQPYSERPPRFAYELSESGRELAGALRLLADWGARSAGAEPYRHEVCGSALEARWYCPTCGDVVDDPDAEDVVVV